MPCLPKVLPLIQLTHTHCLPTDILLDILSSVNLPMQPQFQTLWYPDSFSKAALPLQENNYLRSKNAPKTRLGLTLNQAMKTLILSKLALYLLTSLNKKNICCPMTRIQSLPEPT